MKRLTIRQQCNRIAKWHGMASTAQTIAGMQWYNAAHSLAVALATEHGVAVHQAAQIIAVLSPQKTWETNKREAVAMFNDHFNDIAPSFKYFATMATVCECHHIMAGEFVIPRARIKTYSFADNIAYPSTSNEVTIDRHALRVAYDDTTARIGKVTRLQYNDAATAYRRVAASLGIQAYQLQAIVWVTYKDEVNR